MKFLSDQETEELVRSGRLKMPSEQDIQKHILSEGDQKFAEDLEPLRAIEMLRRAAAAGLPLPPVVAAWLCARLTQYITGQAKSLDAALGLASVKGQHSALSRRRERERLNVPIQKLHWFVSLGAHIDDAAVVVAREFHVGEDRLARKYRALNWGEEGKWFGDVLRQSPDYVARMLAEYPDDPQWRAVKDPILALLPR